MSDAGDERDLLQRAATGDEAALEQLLLAHYDRLARRVSRRVPAFLQGTVSEEDILQQTFMAVFRDIGEFNPHDERAFYRWLCTIAEHRLQDEIKAHRAAKRGGGRPIVTGAAAQTTILDIVDILAAPRRTPSRSVAAHEADAAVRGALEQLAPDHRRILELRFVQGLSVGDAAKSMDRTPAAVNSLCFRALKELQALLGVGEKES